VTVFESSDGTRLVYRLAGQGPPLVVIPGGPMQDASYLADLGGLSARRTLVLLDPRGTGRSDEPADPATYRCDQQVADVEALRLHLGVDRLDLVGHSAGATLVFLYAARHPDRIERLALITPSPRALGVEVADADRRRVAERRRGEVWFGDAFASFERIWAGTATDADWTAIAPFSYGRWDAASRDHCARGDSARNDEAASRYYAPGAFDPDDVRSAVGKLPVPVLVVAGEYDVGLPPERADDCARLFPRARLAVLPGAGHFPWLDDPDGLVVALSDFLD
jgi:pimeloyl-ACP methyl ester carboxylesterase